MQTRLFILTVVAWLSWPLAALAQADSDLQIAQIILVGSAQDSADLRLVMRELLQRDGVEPEFTLSARFSAAALLDEPASDGRVRVFVSLPSATLARLYLRGPFGHRFLLRELSLRDGLDELGCESIAQVVATSTQALLHSGAGIDREAARAGLSHETDSAPPASAAIALAPKPAPPAVHESLHMQLEIVGRASAAWTGAALRQRLGGGVEIGLRERVHTDLWLRQRLVFEQFARQALRPRGFEADVRASVLRLGLDLTRAWGGHSFGGGLAAGVDLLAIAPKHARDPSWSLAKKGVDAVPMLRAELGYERQLGALLLGVSAYADVALIDSHYEVREGTSLRRVAHPWRVVPGVALRLGWRSGSL